MAHYSKLFEKVPLEVQNLSGFDLSHENLFTAKCGTLTPCFVYDCIPNTHLSLSVSSQIQLPPMATDFYGKVDAVFESFFVPLRLLYGGWEEMATHMPSNAVYPTGQEEQTKAKYFPYFRIEASEHQAGSLADYLGYKTSTTYNQPVLIVNPTRFLAYHKIWDDWYRNSFIQNPCFTKPSVLTTDTIYASHLPFASYGGDSQVRAQTDLANGMKVTDLHQRNWSKDYFTTSTPLPQAGLPSKMKGFVELDQTVSFSWSQLSSMNVLQRWLQRNNIAGYRYADQILARFGCLPPDSIMDRAIYLGRTVVPVYTKSVYKTTNSEPSTTNPFSTVGSKYGSSMGVGNGTLIDKFHAREHGIFMTLFSLVPRAYYSTGIDRSFYYTNSMAYADPDFANLGDQEITNAELTGHGVFNEENGTFGYQQRYSEFKYKDDQVHGLLRDGQNLSSFALQRSFSEAPELSSSFLEIPTNFLDQVTAVDNSVSNYGCWVDAYFDCKASMPLPAASIPTLTDPKDVHTVVVSKGGRTL